MNERAPLHSCRLGADVSCLCGPGGSIYLYLGLGGRWATVLGGGGGESRPWWAELAGLRQAVPNLPGSSVNPTCLEKRWSEPAEGLDRQLCQADGWLGETVHARVLPQTGSSVVMEVRSPFLHQTMTLEGRRHLLMSNNLFKKVKWWHFYLSRTICISE